MGRAWSVVCLTSCTMYVCVLGLLEGGSSGSLNCQGDPSPRPLSSPADPRCRQGCSPYEMLRPARRPIGCNPICNRHRSPDGIKFAWETPNALGVCPRGLWIRSDALASSGRPLSVPRETTACWALLLTCIGVYREWPARTDHSGTNKVCSLDGGYDTWRGSYGMLHLNPPKPLRLAPPPLPCPACMFASASVLSHLCASSGWASAREGLRQTASDPLPARRRRAGYREYAPT